MNRDHLGRPARLGRYLFRRAWRIYPTYWAALALATGYYAAFAHDPLITPRWADELRDSLLLLPQPGVPRILPVAWTLSYELMFYAAFAGLFLLPRRAAIPALVGWGVVVVWAAASGYVTTNRFAFLAVSPFVCEFLMGALVGWCFATADRPGDGFRDRGRGGVVRDRVGRDVRPEPGPALADPRLPGAGVRRAGGADRVRPDGVGNVPGRSCPGGGGGCGRSGMRRTRSTCSTSRVSSSPCT